MLSGTGAELVRRRVGWRGDEGEIRGAVFEAGFALIAHQRGLVAEKDQVEIVVVIVIDPDGALRICAAGEIASKGSKWPLLLR